MLKTVKFGGSSLADPAHFKMVRDIIFSDEARKIVVVSAPGKRFSGDNKVTDLLYLCYAQDVYKRQEMCMPGDNVDMDVELIAPIAIEQGLRFAIREGGRTVGSGVVIGINE